jgi:hypothetical protein
MKTGCVLLPELKLSADEFEGTISNEANITPGYLH